MSWSYPALVARRASSRSLGGIMKLIGYTAVVIGFLVGWIGVAILVRRFINETMPGILDYGQHNILVDWLTLPGSVLGLPVGYFLAYMMAWGLKRNDPK